jgi:hypothetical protein
MHLQAIRILLKVTDGTECPGLRLKPLHKAIRITAVNYPQGMGHVQAM